MSVEFTGSGAQNIDFGSPSGVVGLTSKTVSMWIRPHDISSDNTQGIFHISEASPGTTNEYFELYPVLAKIYLLVNFSGTNGQWHTTNNVLTASTWYHVCITYNASATTNDPIFYINGTSVSRTEDSTPTGTFDSGTSTTLYISNKVSGYAFDGEIADLRVYNTILTLAQVTALFAAGAFTPNFDTNLVFNAPLNNCTALSGSAYGGFTLTSSQIFYDRISCVQGTPAGSPLGSDTNPS